jgi:hypothetical protein
MSILINIAEKFRPCRADSAAGKKDGKRTLPEFLLAQMLTRIDIILTHIVNILFHVLKLKKGGIAIPATF